jgi:hypothetical protein
MKIYFSALVLSVLAFSLPANSQTQTIVTTTNPLIIDSLKNQGVWSVSTPYNLNDVVTYQNSTYVSLVGSNIDHIPSGSSQYWQALGLSSLTSAELQAWIGPGVYDPYGAAAAASSAANSDIPLSQKGAIDGVAALDDNGYIFESEVPPLFPDTTGPLCNTSPFAAITCTQAQLTSVIGNYYDAYGSASQAATLALEAQATANAAVPESAVGQPNGVPSLNSQGQIPTAEIPAISVNNVFPVTSQAQMLALNAVIGDMAINTATGYTYVLATLPASTLTDWIAMAAPGSGVASVNGYTGVVNLSFSNIAGDVLPTQLPAPTTSSLGGVYATNALPGYWVNSISSTGVPSLSEINFANVIGNLGCGQLPALTGGVTNYGCAMTLTPSAVVSSLSGENINPNTITASTFTAPNLTVGYCVAVGTGGSLISVPCGGNSGTAGLDTMNTWSQLQTFDGGITVTGVTDTNLPVGDCVVIGPSGQFQGTSCGAGGNANLAQNNTWTGTNMFTNGVTANTVVDQALTAGECVEAGTGGVLESVPCGEGEANFALLNATNIFTMPQEINLASTTSTTALQIYEPGILTGSSINMVIGASSGNYASTSLGYNTQTGTGNIGLTGSQLATFNYQGSWNIPYLATGSLSDTGNLGVTGTAAVTGAVTMGSTLGVTGIATFGTIKAASISDSSLTSGYCLEAGANGLITGVNCATIAVAGGNGYYAPLAASNNFTGEQTLSGAATPLDVVSSATTGTGGSPATPATFYSSINYGAGTTAITVANGVVAGSDWATELAFYSDGTDNSANNLGEIGLSGGSLATFNSGGNWTIPGTLTVSGQGEYVNSITDYALAAGECLEAGTGGLIVSIPCSEIATGGAEGATLVANTFTGIQTIDLASTSTQYGLQMLMPNLLPSYQADLMAGLDDTTNNDSAFFGFKNVGGTGSATNLGVFGVYGGTPITFTDTGALTVPGGVSSPSVTDSALTTPGDCVTVGTGGLLSQAVCGGVGVNVTGTPTAGQFLIATSATTADWQTFTGATLAANTFTGAQTISDGGATALTVSGGGGGQAGGTFAATGTASAVFGNLASDYGIFLYSSIANASYGTMLAVVDSYSAGNTFQLGQTLNGTGDTVQMSFVSGSPNKGELGLFGDPLATFDTSGNWVFPANVSVASLTTSGDCVTVGSGGLLSEAPCGGATLTSNTFTGAQTIAATSASALTIEPTAAAAGVNFIFNTALTSTGGDALNIGSSATLGDAEPLYIAIGYSNTTNNEAVFGYTSTSGGSSEGFIGLLNDPATYATYNTVGAWTFPSSISATNVTDSALTVPGDCVTVGTGGLLSEATCGTGGGATLGANTFTGIQTITSSGTAAFIGEQMLEPSAAGNESIVYLAGTANTTGNAAYFGYVTAGTVSATNAGVFSMVGSSAYTLYNSTGNWSFPAAVSIAGATSLTGGVSGGLIITDSSSTSAATFEDLNPGLNAGQYNSLTIGVATTENNSVNYGFEYLASGSTTNKGVIAMANSAIQTTFDGNGNWIFPAAVSITGAVTATTATASIRASTVTTIASATTIAPTTSMVNVSGTSTITTITAPTGFSSTVGGCMTFIATGAWSTTTGGNILSPAFTATVDLPYQACYNGSSWFIK